MEATGMPGEHPGGVKVFDLRVGLGWWLGWGRGGGGKGGGRILKMTRETDKGFTPLNLVQTMSSSASSLYLTNEKTSSLQESPLRSVTLNDAKHTKTENQAFSPIHPLLVYREEERLSHLCILAYAFYIVESSAT